MDKKETDSNYSSSDSDSDVEETVDVNSELETSTQALTLVDDEAPLLIQPLEDEGEGEGDQGGTYGDYKRQYEYEGEGEEETIDRIDSSQTTDTVLSKDGEKKKKKKKKKKWLHICLTNCKYDVVRKMSRKFGFKEVSEDDSDWTLYWTDYSVALERVMDMKKYQKINHFPGMNEICRKDLLSRNLNRMFKLYPKEYNVFPKTWCLPADHGDFLSYTRQKKNKTYILKPESGCQGKGIWVTKNPKEVKPHEHQICQVYLNKPFLIDGFKFDLRLYVVVTSCDPLRIFLFKDGLARFATHKYSEPTNNNSDNVYMHLTNYAINKHSSDFIKDDDEAGSKRRITTIMKYLQDKGYDVDKLWDDIDDVITKTMISAHSVLKHNYRTCFPNHVKGSACFEILGFDILLDRKLRPLVLEVNHSPSFNTDAQIDRDIKGTLVWDTLNIVNFGACDKRRCIEEEKKRIKDRLMGKYTKKETKEELEAVQAQYLIQQEKYEGHHCGNLRRIYPNAGSEKYDKFFQSSGTLFQETAAFKARSEMARQQREEILRKKEKQDAIMKGKKKDGLRPESPTARKRRTLRRTTMPSRKLNVSRLNGDIFGNDSRAESSEDIIDTKHPMDILEEEELERISGLLQRDNLVRGLGIVEHVYRLLHCTPGTMGALKSDARTLSGPMSGDESAHNSNQLDSNSHHSHFITTSSSLPYSTTNISLTQNNSNVPTSIINTVPANTMPFGAAIQSYSKLSNSNYASIPFLPFSIPLPTISTFSASNRQNAQSLNQLSSNPQYNNGSTRWHKTGNLTNLIDRSTLSLQRSKFQKKPVGSGRSGPVTVVPEPDYRNFLDTEMEKSHILVKSSNDWRNDLVTPTQKNRVVSAHSKRDSELPRFSPHLASHGLSVVSAPAPVVQRPDLAVRQDLSSPHSALSRISSQHSVNESPTRSTKSQRIRGASNNLRLRQMEMRENHAFVYS
ncbi:tubulin polyglutamylase ttll6 isoform X1 [Patella vulgata]|uniref:tubulin polyglutamylase ttll6 isoform X1 n=1 Tax=Patella vulgata TaxID=6465 RepID=UPI0024A9295B|nr:tubulin polyglutamylase ttll6 isoform X1 [Patella vulgata]